MGIETAGARLKKVRQERGISLEDIQKRTKIHPNVLRAIEGDSISDLSPIYLKGFIKIYCASLGVDPKDYIGQSNPPSKPVLNATVGRPIGGRVEHKSSLLKDASVRLSAIKPKIDFKKFMPAVIAAFILVFLLVNLTKFVSSRRKVPLAKVKVLIPPASKKDSAKTIASKSVADGLTVGIFARSKSWISAKADGKTVFHGALARGRSETWHAKEKVELSLGDAGAVELQINDQRFTNLGRRGKPLKNIVINKEGLKIPR